jgi:hypothetical protein
MKINKTITVKSHVRKVVPSKKVIIQTGYKGDYRFVPVKGIFVDAYRFVKRLVLSLITALILAFLLMQLFMHINENANLQKDIANKQAEMIRLEEANKRLKEEMAKDMVKGPVSKDAVKNKIKEYFPNSYIIMTAIANAESHFNNDAMNWNCYYNKDKSIVYTTRVKGSHSTFCKPEHRKYSWSIDCFVFMKNYVGLKECPKDITLDEHLAEMAVLSKQRGFQPWSSYNAGVHEEYLTQK